MNPEALEKGTHSRNHQTIGLPWARYSVDELNQQAKAGDRPYPGDLRSIFWAAPHDPDEDFHWTRQISSWTLPGLLGLFGHSYTLRQLWGVWESLPLLQGPKQRGPKNKAQNQTRLAGWETLKEDARCFLKEEGLPFPQTGPEWRLVCRAMGKVLAARAFLTDTPAEVMQLPVQDVADSKEQMILRAVCDERISVPVEVLRGVQGPHGPHWRPGGPGGGEGQLALQHEAVVGRRSPRLSGPLHLPQARLHQRHDQADGPGPLRPWVPDRCRWP